MALRALCTVALPAALRPGFLSNTGFLSQARATHLASETRFPRRKRVSQPLEIASMTTERPRTLGELKESGYRIESVKDEMRRNLIAKIRAGAPLFPEILGYDETVVPQVQNAILSKH